MMKKFIALWFLTAFFCAENTFATPISLNVLSCIDAAAKIYQQDRDLLIAIAKTESSLNPHIVGTQSKNGSIDIGLMQINSSWLPKLARHGISKADLFDPCVNARVGAWVLWENQKQYGKTWKAVGAYNAHKNVDAQRLYVSKVWKNYQQLKGVTS